MDFPITSITLHENFLYIGTETDMYKKQIGGTPFDTQLLSVIINLQLLFNGKQRITLNLGKYEVTINGDIFTCITPYNCSKHKCMIGYRRVFTKYYKYLCAQLLETALYIEKCNKRYFLTNSFAKDVARVVENNPDVTPDTFWDKFK